MNRELQLALRSSADEAGHSLAIRTAATVRGTDHMFDIFRAVGTFGQRPPTGD